MKQRGEKKIRPCIKARVPYVYRVSFRFIIPAPPALSPSRERRCESRFSSIFPLLPRFDKRNLDAWSKYRRGQRDSFFLDKDECGWRGIEVSPYYLERMFGMISSFLVRVEEGANRWSIENEEGNEISFCTTFIVGYYFHRNFISRDVSISEYWQGNHRLTNVILFSFFLFFWPSRNVWIVSKTVYTNRAISRAIDRSCFDRK